nr:unnamed protein product [Spirometra erinaceieuropaei]
MWFNRASTLTLFRAAAIPTGDHTADASSPPTSSANTSIISSAAPVTATTTTTTCLTPTTGEEPPDILVLTSIMQTRSNTSSIEIAPSHHALVWSVTCKFIALSPAKPRRTPDPPLCTDYAHSVTE